MPKRLHDELTTDDLLRLQEEPLSKKTRVSTSVSADSRHLNPSRSTDGSGSISSTSSGDESTDQAEVSEEDGDSSRSQVDEDQDDSDCSEIGDSGRLKLSRASPVSTHTPKLAQVPKNSIRSFNDMGISSALEAALHRMSIHMPTKVQAACIPPILAGTS